MNKYQIKIKYKIVTVRTVLMKVECGGASSEDVS